MTGTTGTPNIITTPSTPVSRYQAISDIIESIALEETGLAHVINAEGEKIQAALVIATTIDELVTINESVRKTLIDISKIEMLLQYKLDILNSSNFQGVQPLIIDDNNDDDDNNNNDDNNDDDNNDDDNNNDDDDNNNDDVNNDDDNNNQELT